ncbi:MAG: isochorismatase family protein [Chloroflexota bacterium]
MNDTSHLIDVNDSLLIVIDVQSAFLEKLPEAESAALVQRICWLIEVSIRLSVPIVVTAEDIPTLGDSVPQIADSLPAGQVTFNKMTFGLAAQTDIMAAVENTGRKSAILVGLETDVCVAHSALGLLQKGYRVVVVADATGSPESGHHFGLARMRDAGVIVSSVKGLFYEWVPTVAENSAFMETYREAFGDPGVVL